CIYRLQCREDFGTLALRHDRAAGTFQLAHARVTIQPDNEHISQSACEFEAANMPGMQQVKASVGENDAAAVAFLAAKPQNRFLQREDRTVQRVSMRTWTKLKMSSTEKPSLSRAGGTAPARGALTMKSVSAYRAIAGVLLCAAGAWL